MEQASQEAAIAGAEALETRPGSAATLAEITVSTLILTGQQNSLYPYEVSQLMNEAILNSELVLLPGAAHAAIIAMATRPTLPSSSGRQRSSWLGDT